MQIQGRKLIKPTYDSSVLLSNTPVRYKFKKLLGGLKRCHLQMKEKYQKREIIINIIKELNKIRNRYIKNRENHKKFINKISEVY